MGVCWQLLLNGVAAAFFYQLPLFQARGMVLLPCFGFSSHLSTSVDRLKRIVWSWAGASSPVVANLSRQL